MQKVKWLFYAYVLLCCTVAAGMAVSFAITRTRDPQTNYGTFGGNLKTLDPAEVGDAGAADLDGYVYECLYNYAHGEDKYRLIPELADGAPAVSADGKTYTIRLKHGVHFYDPRRTVFPGGTGPEVTADDFIYSWKRVCNFHLGFTSNYGQVFQGHVEGIDDWFAYTQSCTSNAAIDWNRPISGLTAIDRYTLQIRLTAPFPQLQFNLAMMPTAVVSRAAVAFYGDDFKNIMLGTGPYAMSEYLPDQQIVYTANPLYRGGPNVQSGTVLADADRMPHIQRVQLNSFEETLPPWYLFLQGKLDASAIPKDTFGQAINTGSGTLTDQMVHDGIRLTTSKNPEVSYIAFNLNDPILGKNKPLRQAMSLAFDRQRYIDLYLNGRGLPANGPIPPGFPTYEADRMAPYCRFDLTAAKAKMKEAEAINGGPIPPLHLLMGDTTTAKTQEADFIVTSMRQIGLTMLPDFKPYGTFLSMIDRGQAQVWSLGWTADYPDEQDFWQLFYSGNIGPGGLNGSGYRNPAFDALYEQSATMPAGVQRTVLYKQMQGMVLDDCPWIFTVHTMSYQLYHNWYAKPWLSLYGHGLKAYQHLDAPKRAAWLTAGH
jgi:oligopeptide transport system substrate-binding protein